MILLNCLVVSMEVQISNKMLLKDMLLCFQQTALVRLLLKFYPILIKIWNLSKCISLVLQIIGDVLRINL